MTKRHGKFRRKTMFLTVFCLLFTLLMPVFALAATPSDISNHWAKNTIQSWVDKGFIAGYPDGSFKPDNNISRAEFITLVNKAYGYTETSPITFSDVSPDAWYANAVAVAIAAGYINGFPDGTMRPDSPISREQAASIVMYINNLEANASAANGFTDATAMIWSKGAIGAVAEADIMNGYPDGSFGPQKPITRAEAVVSLDRAIDYEPTPVPEPGTPPAPDVTRNDVSNTVSGMTTAMEYKFDSGSWAAYVASVFNDLNFSGNHTLMVRYAAEGINPYGPATTLTFTTNVVSGGGGGGLHDVAVSDINVTGDAVVGATLTAAPTPGAATGTYQWIISDTVDGTYTNIAGATASTYTIVAGDATKFVKATFTASGSYTGTQTSTATAAILGAGPAAPAGITATDATAAGANDGTLVGTVAGQEYNVDGGAVWTAITGTPVIGLAPGSYTVRVAETATNEAGTATAALVIAGGSSSVAVSDITVTGTAQVGVTLTGTVAPTGATASYQWKISTDGTTYTDIAGATASTYTPVPGDETKYIKVVTTGTGNYYGTVTSAATEAVASVDGSALTVEPVNLGTAGDYAILSKTGISSVPNSVITGDIGVSPAAASYITGFSLDLPADGAWSTSSQVTGKVYAPGYADPTPANLTTAISNMETAYTDAAGRAADYTELYTGDISGKTLTAGVYKWSTDVLINTDVTLSGGADDVWIFQIAGKITQASATSILLTGGAQANNIFWQAADTVAIGTGAHFEGIILGMTNITLGTNASINGRLLAQTAVTLQANTVTALPQL